MSVNILNEYKCYIFGKPTKLPVKKLPTYEDVIRYKNLLKVKIRSEKKLIKFVSSGIIEIWEKKCIPVFRVN